jgi:hypothetical protein
MSEKDVLEFETLALDPIREPRRGGACPLGTDNHHLRLAHDQDGRDVELLGLRYEDLEP